MNPIPDSTRVDALRVVLRHWLVPGTLNRSEQLVVLWLIAEGYVYPSGITQNERVQIRQALDMLPDLEQRTMRRLRGKGLVRRWQEGGVTYHGIDATARPAPEERASRSENGS